MKCDGHMNKTRLLGNINAIQEMFVCLFMYVCMYVNKMFLMYNLHTISTVIWLCLSLMMTEFVRGEIKVNGMSIVATNAHLLSPC